MKYISILNLDLNSFWFFSRLDFFIALVNMKRKPTKTQTNGEKVRRSLSRVFLSFSTDHYAFCSGFRLASLFTVFCFYAI